MICIFNKKRCRHSRSWVIPGDHERIFTLYIEGGITNGKMNRGLLAGALIIILASVFAPAVYASGGGNLVGKYADYAVTLSGNIGETLSFNVQSYSTGNGTYVVSEASGGSSTSMRVDPGHLYSAFPVLSVNSTTAAVEELVHSPLDSYGYRSVIGNYSTATFYAPAGKKVSFTAGTYNAIELNDSAVYSQNGTYISITVNCFIDSSSGLILELLMNIDDNGTNLASYAQITETDMAQKVIAGLDVPLIVAGASISVVAVLAAMIMLQRKK